MLAAKDAEGKELVRKVAEDAAQRIADMAPRADAGPAVRWGPWAAGRSARMPASLLRLDRQSRVGPHLAEREIRGVGPDSGPTVRLSQ